MRALWIDALSKIDDDLDVDVKPLGVLKLFDGGFGWETLAKDLTNIEEVFGKGKGAYFLDPDHDRRYLTQFAGLLMERTVGFVRVTRRDAQRRSYRFELVIEGQSSSPLRSVLDVDLDAPSPPGLKISPQPITFGSVPLGEVRTRTLTIENASGANVDVSIAPSPTGSPFTWPSFSGVPTHRAQQQITVQFRPTSNAFVEATLTVTGNAPGSPQSVALTGKGPGGIPPDPGPGLPTSLDVSPTVMSFGSGPLGTVRRRTLTIGNMTGATVNLSVSPPPAGPFTWTAFTGTLAHGARRQIEV